MKKLICFLIMVMLVSGCASIKSSQNRAERALEKSSRVSEIHFDSEYRDVFLAIVQLMNDGLQTIYKKNFDEGVILVSWSAHAEGAVGCSYGFWLERVNNKKTKVILKIHERNAQGGGYLIGLTVDDLFNRLKKEVELQERLRK